MTATRRHFDIGLLVGHRLLPRSRDLVAKYKRTKGDKERMVPIPDSAVERSCQSRHGAWAAASVPRKLPLKGVVRKMINKEKT